MFFQKIAVKISIVIILVAGAFILGMFTSCKSLKIYKVSKVQSCNNMYTQMDYNLQHDIKDTALVLKWMDKCLADTEDRKEKDCEKWIYQGKKVDPKNYKRKSYFLECSK